MFRSLYSYFLLSLLLAPIHLFGQTKRHLVVKKSDKKEQMLTYMYYNDPSAAVAFDNGYVLDLQGGRLARVSTNVPQLSHDNRFAHYFSYSPNKIIWQRFDLQSQDIVTRDILIKNQGNQLKYEDYLGHLDVDPGGRFIAFVENRRSSSYESLGRSIILWDIVKKKQVLNIKTDQEPTARSEVFGFSPDGQYFLVVQAKKDKYSAVTGKVEVYSLPSCRKTLSFKIGKGYFWWDEMYYSTDGHYIRYTPMRKRGTEAIYRLKDSRQVSEKDIPQRDISWMPFVNQKSENFRALGSYKKVGIPIVYLDQESSLSVKFGHRTDRFPEVSIYFFERGKGYLILSKDGTYCGNEIGFKYLYEKKGFKDTIKVQHPDPTAYDPDLLKRIAFLNRPDIRKEIQAAKDASGLYGPKGEFETTKAYYARQGEGRKLAEELRAKYLSQFAEQNKLKIEESLATFSIPLENLGRYQADKGRYPIQYLGKKDTLLMAPADAKLLKEQVRNIKILADRQLQENGRIFDTFNLRLIHPVTKVAFPLGPQRKPLLAVTDEEARNGQIKPQTERQAVEEKMTNTKMGSDNLSSSLASSAKPTISWVKKLPKQTAEAAIQLRALVSYKGVLGLKQILHNDRLMDCAWNQVEQGWELNCPVRLLEGPNEFVVQVAAKDGVFMAFDPITTIYNPVRKNYALLFATADYEAPEWKRLPNTLTGAQKIKWELENRFGFTVELILNPSLETINTTLYRYRQKRFNPDDQLLVFFAGHGEIRKSPDGSSIGYLVAKDSKSPQQDPTRRTYLRHSSLEEDLSTMACRHILVVMDACFSSTFGMDITEGGSMARPRRKYLANRQEKSAYVRELLKRRSRLYLLAGESEVLAGGQGELSPFTQQLWYALTNREALADGLVEFAELTALIHAAKLNPAPKAGYFSKNEAGATFIFQTKE